MQSRQRSPGERYTVDSYRRSIERATAVAFPEPQHLARVKVPESIPRFVRLEGASDDAIHLLPLEELIARSIQDLFPGLLVVFTKTDYGIVGFDLGSATSRLPLWRADLAAQSRKP